MIREVPGRHSTEMLDGAPKAIKLPDPHLLVDCITTPCNHECKVIKLKRHARQAFMALSSLNPVKPSLMRATTGRCGTDSSAFHSDTVKEVAKLDRPGFGNDEDFSEATLFCAATLHKFGLPYDYAKLDSETLPGMCSCCKASLWDPAVRGSRMEKVFAWQCNLGRCGEDGRRLQAHEVVKWPFKDLILINLNPSGDAFPYSGVLYEPMHLPMDTSRPDDIMTLGRGRERLT